MKCDDAKILMESDARSAADERALNEHVRLCESCATYAADMSAQNALLQRALKPRADELRVEKLKQRVADQIERERRQPFRRPFVVYAAGLAAMVALSVGVYVALRSGKTGSETQVATPVKQEISGDLFAQVADLQSRVRSTQVLDELVQLQVAFDAPDDADGKSTAEDAELYIERILALNGRNEMMFRETLQGVNRSGIQGRLKKLRDSMSPDSPAQVLASLKLAIATFDEAGRITRTAWQVTPGKEGVAYAE